MPHHPTSPARALPVLATLLLAAATAAATPLTTEATYPVGIERGIVYGQGATGAGGTTALLLDRYYPRTEAPLSQPAVVLVHGGNFESLDRTHAPQVMLARFFASRGIAAFSIEYRLLKDNPPAPRGYGDTPRDRAQYAAISDTKAAIRFVRAHAADFGVDPARIGVMGSSAGGTCALGTALTDSDDFAVYAPDDATFWANTPGVSAKPAAAVALWGNGDLFLDEIDADDPPLLLIHGTADQKTHTPFGASERVYKRCHAVGVPCEFFELTGARHAPWQQRYEGWGAPRLAFNFFREHL